MAAVTIDQLVKDARRGVRVVRRDPCATAAAVLSLALSMGANTAVFSIAHAYFLRDWQVRSPQELVFVRARASTGERIGRFPWRIIEQLRGSHPTLTAVSAFDESTVTVTIGGRAEGVRATSSRATHSRCSVFAQLSDGC